MLTKKILLYISLLFIPVITTIAQVTIGTGSPPVDGALLDLKEYEPNQLNSTSTKGLQLPRVELEDIYMLKPMYTTQSEYENPDNKRKHIGLIVYNIAYDPDKNLHTGMHIWDGEKWRPFMIEDVERNDMYEPNCYIVKPGESIDIPVRKAYEVWEHYITEGFQNETLDGLQTAELLWQSEDNLLIGPTILNNWIIPLTGNDRSAYMSITTNENLDGNVVIVFKVDGVVRWSWHIWITDYDPNSIQNQKSYNGYTFMDRNLGAFGNNFELGTETFGLFYQWGRKDPFPPSVQLKQNTEPTLFGQKSGINTITYTTKANNLAESIQNPATHYICGQLWGNYDWYSSTTSNNYLWDESGHKSAFDPCPLGWRVPLPSGDDGDDFPWYGLSVSAFDSGKGINWGDAGLYPAAGCRREGGALDYTGTRGCYWTALPPTNVGDIYSYLNFVNDGGGFQEETGICKAFSYSIRCVKE